MEPQDTTRYTSSLLESDLYELQAANGVISDILALHSGMVQPSDLEPRKTIKLHWVANQRYWWDPECELDPFMTSKSLFATLEKIQTYFELHDQESEQPTFGLALDATREAEVSFFSFAEKGLAPAVAKNRIQTDTGIILSYQIFISIMLACHTFGKPRIPNTKDAIER